jgi:phosphoglycolate phosphatase-like HAD superfamily hydrolase
VQALNANVGLVIFDCDGVLVDSEVIFCRAHADILARHGYPITADQVLDRFLGVSDREARLMIENEIRRKLPDDFEQQVKQATLQFYGDDLRAICCSRGPDLRSAVAHRGISRFRARFAPRNDDQRWIFGALAYN